MRLQSDAFVEFRLALIVKLSTEGKKQAAIARLVECSQAWVSKVLQRYRTGGKAALKVKGKAPGKPAYLTQVQLDTLKQMLVKGALHYNFPTDNWTRERIASLVPGQFAVGYHPAHISKLMRRIGFTLQKPERKSFKKEEAVVEQWRNKVLPRLKKKGAARGLSSSVRR